VTADKGVSLFFDKSSVHIITGHLGRSFGKTSIQIRPFYVFKEGKNSTSILASFFYVLDNPINFWYLEFGYGNSPDDRYVLAETGDVFNLDNYSVKLKRNIYISPIFETSLSLGYSYEEYFENLYRNRYLVEIIFGYKF